MTEKCNARMLDLATYLSSIGDLRPTSVGPLHSNRGGDTGCLSIGIMRPSEYKTA